MSKAKLTSKLSVIQLKQPLPDHTSNSANDDGWSYAGPKNGGTDIGYKVKDSQNVQHLVKTGIGTGLLWQIVEAEAANKEGGKKKLGFILGDYLRLTNTKVNAEERKSLEELLYNAFIFYCETDEGINLLSNVKNQSATSNDVHSIQEYMYKLDPMVRNIIGIVAVNDIISGAVSQKFVDDYQRTYLSDQQMPTASVIIDGKGRPFIASKFVDNAISLDDFLESLFYKQQTLIGKPLEQLLKLV